MVWSVITSRCAAADGTLLAWHEHRRPDGAPPPRHTIVLTNGVGTTARFWGHVASELARDHRVIHWNYRGHGASERSRSGDYSIATHADDLLRVTRAVNGGEPVVHAGFSMGVTVLLELYRRRPDLASALVLVSGPPDAPYANTLPLRLPGTLRAVHGSMHVLTPIVPWLAPAFNAFTTSRLAYPMARLLRTLQATAPREEIDAFTEELAAMDPMAFWASATSLMAAHASDVLPRVTVPVLVLGAAKDQFVPKSQIEQLAARLPHARLVMIEEAGHGILIEAGPRVVAEVRRFLSLLG